jgi:hypothetical protein
MIDKYNAMNIIFQELEKDKFLRIPLKEVRFGYINIKKYVYTYAVKVTTRSYSNKISDKSRVVIFNCVYDNFESCFNSIYNFYTNEGVLNYSKISDDIFTNEEEKTQSDNFCKAVNFITHKNLEDCSVCFEENCVLTSCGHNLCRICAQKLSDFLCPICREKLGCSCGYDCEEEEDLFPNVSEEESEGEEESEEEGEEEYV